MAATKSNGLNRGLSDPALYDKSTDSGEIRQDIDRTRGEMDRTIDELGERLQPQNLFDDLMCSVRDSLFGPRPAGSSGQRETSKQISETAGQMACSLGRAIRENPVPAALMGAGLAWLLVEDKAERSYRRFRHDRLQDDYTGDRWSDPGTRGGSFVDARTEEPYAEDYGAGYEDFDGDGEPETAPSSLKDKAAGMAHALGSTAGKSAHAVQSAASMTGRAVTSAGHSLRSAGHRTSDLSRSAGRSMKHAGISMRDDCRSAADSVQHYGQVMSDRLGRGYEAGCERFERALNDKPMAVGVAALAAGLLAGFALPRTRAEDRMVGRSSDRLRDDARRTARDVTEQGKEIAARMADVAVSDADSQGVYPGNLGDKFARVAREAMHAASESARREGIDPKSLGEKARHVGETAMEAGKSEIEQRKLDDSETPPSELPTTLGDAGPLAVEAGGLSDDVSAPQRESATKHDIAEGMSRSSSNQGNQS